jgi:hypothetical protein
MRGRVPSVHGRRNGLRFVDSSIRAQRWLCFLDPSAVRKRMKCQAQLARSVAYRGRLPRPAALLGIGLGDRFEVFQVRSGAFKETVWQADKPPKLQGKHANKPSCEVT